MYDVCPAELVNIHNAFHQGQYQHVIDFDTSSFSPENALPARLLQLRAKIALGQTADVLAEIADDETPDLAAVKALAQHTAGEHDTALRAAQTLAGKASDNATVQVLCGTVLHAQGKTDEALALLAKHQGNLEAVALTVQIYLQTNRVDLALKEVQAAKRWAQDSLVFNLAESWVGMRVVRLLTIRYQSLTDAVISPGRREIPIRLLRLRRTRLQPLHRRPAVHRRPGRRRAAPGPPARGRGRAVRRAAEIPGRRADHREHDRVERAEWEGSGGGGVDQVRRFRNGLCVGCWLMGVFAAVSNPSSRIMP